MLLHDECDELLLLGPAQLAALAADAAVRNQLKSTELRVLVRSIDGSRSRLDALAAARGNIVDFDTFCRAVLHAIAISGGGERRPAVPLSA